MDERRVEELFNPHFSEAIAAVRGGARLVHYTSAEAATRILTGREVWLRNALLMNDYSEMKHGLECLRAGWNSEAGLKLREWLDATRPGLQDRLREAFDGQASGLLNETYLVSLSQHDDDEDKLGRLSMWRAYGGKAGVALVLNTHPFLSEEDATKIYSTPVLYEDIDTFVGRFGHWADTLRAAENELQEAVDDDWLIELLLFTFRGIVIATKHPGFHEEKEWRVFHSPLLEGGSPWLKFETEVIDAVPQMVIKLQLRDDEAAGVTGYQPDLLINRAIIGPCENPLPIRNALAYAMTTAEIDKPDQRIWMSFIPLRQR